MSIQITPIKVAYHRNGVSGAGFHVVTFYEQDTNEQDTDYEHAPLMVGIVFEEPLHVAVLDINLLAAGIIEFARNSWRGDRFESVLRQTIEDWYEASTKE